VNADDSDGVFQFGSEGKQALIDRFDPEDELVLDDAAFETALANQSETDGRDDAD